MAMCVYPLGVLDIIGGVSACFIIVAFSRFIESHAATIGRFLQWVGRNTLPIFTLHIVEDNAIPWGTWGVQLSQALDGAWFAWILLLLIRLLIDAALVAIVYTIPKIREVYFPQLKKRNVPS